MSAFNSPESGDRPGCVSGPSPLLKQLDALFIPLRFIRFTHLATDCRQLGIGFNQELSIGCRIFDVGKTAAEVVDNGLNFFMLADQRGASLGRSAKNKSHKDLPNRRGHLVQPVARQV